MAQNFTSAQTDEDFHKAHNKAIFNEIQHFLNPEEAELISFSDIKKLLKPENELYKGMQVVPVKSIVGSEDRYRDFDNRFFPKRLHLKSRWEHIDMAHIKDIPLPPIKLYELGGLYFVRDGNHRVSVARARKVEFIDAEVVSLQSEIKLSPGMSLSKITKKVIAYEKRVFYFETSFGDITDNYCLDFTTPGQYDVIYNHILTHKYYINMNKAEEIPWDEAVLSWYDTVYLPFVRVISHHKLMKHFKGRTISDLYVWLIKYWDELKTKFGENYSLDDVAQDFSKQFGNYPFTKIGNKIKKFLLLKK